MYHAAQETAKHRAQFGWPPVNDAAACSNEDIDAKPVEICGVPQTPEPISGVSEPKFAILWGHVEDILLLNKFFSDCRYVPQLRSPTRLCDGAEMAIFGDFFASCVLSEPRAAGFRPAS